MVHIVIRYYRIKIKMTQDKTLMIIGKRRYTVTNTHTVLA